MWLNNDDEKQSSSTVLSYVSFLFNSISYFSIHFFHCPVALTINIYKYVNRYFISPKRDCLQTNKITSKWAIWVFFSSVCRIKRYPRKFSWYFSSLSGNNCICFSFLCTYSLIYSNYQWWSNAFGEWQARDYVNIDSTLLFARDLTFYAISVKILIIRRICYCRKFFFLFQFTLFRSFISPFFLKKNAHDQLALFIIIIFVDDFVSVYRCRKITHNIDRWKSK